MAIVRLDVTGFVERVLGSTLPTLVVFWSDRAAPCQAVWPALQVAAAHLSGRVDVVLADTEHDSDLAVRYGVQRIPCFMVCVGGNVLSRIDGGTPSASGVVQMVAAVVPGIPLLAATRPPTSSNAPVRPSQIPARAPLQRAAVAAAGAPGAPGLSAGSQSADVMGSSGNGGLELTPGTQLEGRYEVVRLLGRGAMAAVYEVRHLGLHSRHALKVLDPGLATSPELRQRFLAEGRIQAQLRHPNIVAVTEIVSTPVAGLVEEYVDGKTLNGFVRGLGRKITIPEAVFLMNQILDALDAAHAFGIVHRDLKPENILIGLDARGRPQPRVTDFGIAKITAAADITGTKGKTQAGVRMGTLLYMSPEQIRGVVEVDQRTDIFALGAILYELVTGKPAFDASTEFDIMRKIVAGDYEPPERIVGGLPPSIAASIGTALAVDVAKRFASCDAFRAALTGLPS